MEEVSHYTPHPPPHPLLPSRMAKWPARVEDGEMAARVEDGERPVPARVSVYLVSSYKRTLTAHKK